MRVRVDQDSCIGCELCTQTCPEVFKMENSLAVAYADPVPAGSEETAAKAVDECPVACIEIL